MLKLKKVLSVWFLGLLLGSIIGCTSTVNDNQSVKLSGDISYRLQAVKNENINTGELVHIVVDMGNEQRQFLVQIEITDSTLTLSGMSAEGVSLFLLTWHLASNQIQSKVYFPVDLDPLRVLAELQLSRWPVTDVDIGLQGATVIQASSNTRKIVTKNETIYVIEQKDGKWLLSNLLANYEISITPLEQWKLL